LEVGELSIKEKLGVLGLAALITWLAVSRRQLLSTRTRELARRLLSGDGLRPIK
jgi:hypothetical protein